MARYTLQSIYIQYIESSIASILSDHSFNETIEQEKAGRHFIQSFSSSLEPKHLVPRFSG